MYRERDCLGLRGDCDGMEPLWSSAEHSWITTAHHSWTGTSHHSWTSQCPPQLNNNCPLLLDTPVPITAAQPQLCAPLPITSHSSNPKALLGNATHVPSICTGALDACPWQSLLQGVAKSALEAGWALWQPESLRSAVPWGCRKQLKCSFQEAAGTPL